MLAAAGAVGQAEAEQFVQDINYVATKLIAVRGVIDAERAAGRTLPPELIRAWTDTKLALSLMVSFPCEASRLVGGASMSITLPRSVSIGSPCERLIPDDEFVRRLRAGSPSAFPQQRLAGIGAAPAVVGLVALAAASPLLAAGVVIVLVVVVGAVLWKLADIIDPTAIALSFSAKKNADTMATIAQAVTEGRLTAEQAKPLLDALKDQNATTREAARDLRKKNCKGFFDCLAAELSGSIKTVIVIGGVGAAVYFFGPTLLAAVKSRRISSEAQHV